MAEKWVGSPYKANMTREKIMFNSVHIIAFIPHIWIYYEYVKELLFARKRSVDYTLYNIVMVVTGFPLHKDNTSIILGFGGYFCHDCQVPIVIKSHMLPLLGATYRGHFGEGGWGGYIWCAYEISWNFLFHHERWGTN